MCTCVRVRTDGVCVAQVHGVRPVGGVRHHPQELLLGGQCALHPCPLRRMGLHGTSVRGVLLWCCCCGGGGGGGGVCMCVCVTKGYSKPEQRSKLGVFVCVDL
jgi:hypothetical protein